MTAIIFPDPVDAMEEQARLANDYRPHFRRAGIIWRHARDDQQGIAHVADAIAVDEPKAIDH